MLLQLNTPSFCSPYSQGEVIEFTYILHILTVENEESRGWGEFEYDMGVIQTLRHENYCQFHYQKGKEKETFDRAPYSDFKDCRISWKN